MGSAVLLAFGFGTPWLLWGLALGALPLIIHLLQRRKHRETEWAAMRFLLAAVKKNSRRMRLEQWLLLLVRAAIIVIAVLALAQPQFTEFSPFFQHAAPTHRILLLDTSFSMGLREGDETRIQQARQTIQQILDTGSQGDAWNLVRIASSEPRTIIRQPAYRSEDVLAELEQLILTDEFGEVLPSLQGVAQLVRTLPELPRKEVYLITDWQRTNWAPDAGQAAGEIRSLLRQVGDATRLVLVDVGLPGISNQAVTSVELVDPIVTLRQPARFKVAVSCQGTAPALPVALELHVDGKLQVSRTVSLQSNAEVVEFFTHVFVQGGEHRVEARVAEDSLPLDNQRRLVVPVREQLRVLLLNGKLAGRPRDAATFHLELALRPDPDLVATGTAIVPRVIKSGELRGFDLSEYDVVWACNVSAFDDAEAQLLESFLRTGGCVIWSLGDRVQPENYNRLLYRDGAGILPARIDQRRGNAADPQQGFGFDALEYTHPVVKVFQGNVDTGLERTQTYEYFRTTLNPTSGAKTVLAFSGGDPAIIEQRVGMGQSVLITTAVDQTWGSWALWPSFVPLVQELIHWSVRDAGGDRALRVGEPLQRTVQTRGADVTAVVSRPDSQSEPARSTVQGSLSEFLYERTDLAGWYELQFGPPLSRRETYAVTLDSRESQLAPLTPDELEQELLSGVRYQQHSSQITEDRDNTMTATTWSGWSRWLLYLVLYLLVAEQLLAWNFAVGLWVLCPPWALWNWWRHSFPGRK